MFLVSFSVKYNKETVIKKSFGTKRIWITLLEKNYKPFHCPHIGLKQYFINTCTCKTIIIFYSFIFLCNVCNFNVLLSGFLLSTEVA